jgi:chromosome segregation ATPase
LSDLDIWTSDCIEQEKSAKEFLEELDHEVLVKFKEEYEKVLKVLRKTQYKVNQFVHKYEEAREEMGTVDNQSVDSEKISQDAQTLKQLKLQILRAENSFAAICKREEAGKLETRQLRQDIANLSNTIRQGVGLSASQERTINELISAKEQYTKELEIELEKIVNLRSNLTSFSEKIESLEQERKVIEKEIISLKEKNATKKHEIDLEMKNKEKLERDLKELRIIVTIKSQEATSKQGLVSRATEDIQQIETQIKQQKNLIEKLLKDQELLNQRMVKLQQDYDDQLAITQEILSNNADELQELKVKERELLSHKSEVKRVSRIRDAFLKKSRTLEVQKLEAENIRKVHRSKNETLKTEIDQKRKILEVLKKNADDLRREKDILEAAVKKNSNEASRIHLLVTIQKQQQNKIELETSRIKRDLVENQKQSKEFEIERDKYKLQVEQLEKQMNESLYQIKEKELKIFEYKRSISQSETKLKYHQNLYETVQSDRKLHSKQLIDSQTQIAAMKKRLKIMNFQIYGFKEDVNAKEAMLVKETAEMVKLNKDFNLISEEIKNLKGQNELASAYIKTQMIEENKLDQFVKEAEIERDRQQNALNLIITERDNILSQLLLRNQELNSVYNKIKTQTLSMLRGEKSYKEKMIEIRNVRTQIVDYKVLNAKLSFETTQIPVLEKQIVHYDNLIMGCETRIKALQQELENPINVHRWRKLECSQPQIYEMILLLQSLQKKVIDKNKEEMEKSDAITRKEKLYLHLKAILAKQSGPEANQQVQEFEELLKDKRKKLKHMETELNMYKAQVDEYKYSIGNMNTSLVDLKSKYLQIYMKKLKDPFELKSQELPSLPSVPFRDADGEEANESASETGEGGTQLDDLIVEDNAVREHIVGNDYSQEDTNNLLHGSESQLDGDMQAEEVDGQEDRIQYEAKSVDGDEAEEQEHIQNVSADNT